MSKLQIIRRLSSLTIVTFTLCVSFLISCGGGTRGTTDTTVVVRGVLLDSNGSPVPSIPVSAGGVQGITDTNGSFELEVPEGTNQFSFLINNQTIASNTPPVAAPVQFEFSLSTGENEILLTSEEPIDEPNPSPTTLPTPTSAAPSPTPAFATATPSPTPSPVPAALSLSVNQLIFAPNETATFTISALGGLASPLISKSIVLVVGTLGSGQTSITFSNNETVQFPTAQNDLYYTLSIQNFVQTMQTGSVVFDLPVGIVSENVSLFAQTLAVDSATNALLAQSAAINIEIQP